MITKWRYKILLDSHFNSFIRCIGELLTCCVVAKLKIVALKKQGFFFCNFFSYENVQLRRRTFADNMTWNHPGWLFPKPSLSLHWSKPPF